MADTLRIERREYKYLVDEATIARLRNLIRPFCVLDPYADAAPDHQYTIESLYLDSPDLATYQANFHELIDRYKLRVRRYPDAPQSPYFLEVKRRVHEVQVKSRAMVGPDWADLCDPFVPRARLATSNVERFVTRVHDIGARPTMIVRYRREAWMSVVDDYARVTFDREIRGHLADPERWAFVSDRGWRACDDPTGQRQETSGLTLLEMKFTTRVPTWMVGIVETLGLYRQSFSKYGRLVEAFFIPPENRTPRHAGGFH
ncbi:MAG: polyphosphate polymerase domain-containing protein [Myxococcota bacterium]